MQTKNLSQDQKSPTKEPTHPHNTMTHIPYRFICQKQLNFGQALYITGNIQQLGEWNLSCAVRLDCYMQNYWIIDIDVPIDTEIQYKYFVSSYEHHFSLKILQIQQDDWVGDHYGKNFMLFLGKRDSAKILETRKTQKLKIMSFNLRCQNPDDKDQLHWTNRRQNCLEVIKQHYPSIMGVQEARNSQRSYLNTNLNYLYNYVGVPRGGSDYGDEEVGIFYDKQRFIVVQHGFRWISESKAPGSIGFGATFPRYYTFMILEDTYISQKFHNSLKQTKQEIPLWIPRNLLMVINVHLDHESQLARKKGIQMMSKEVQIKSQQYKQQLKDIFIFGDFNSAEIHPMFKRFTQTKPKLHSIRSHFERKNEKDFCDYQYTFNGFLEKPSDVTNPHCMIDHMFIHTSVYKPSQFQVIRQMIHQPKNSKYNIVSDHFPILGIFKLLRSEMI